MDYLLVPLAFTH